MTENHIYDLMAQLVEENKSIWRIKNKYFTDTAKYPECKGFFEKLLEKKENTVAELTQLIKYELDK